MFLIGELYHYAKSRTLMKNGRRELGFYYCYMLFIISCFSRANLVLYQWFEAFSLIFYRVEVLQHLAHCV